MGNRRMLQSTGMGRFRRYRSADVSRPSPVRCRCTRKIPAEAAGFRAAQHESMHRLLMKAAGRRCWGGIGQSGRRPYSTPQWMYTSGCVIRRSNHFHLLPVIGEFSSTIQAHDVRASSRCLMGTIRPTGLDRDWKRTALVSTAEQCIDES
jgi:hypothetical protein